MIDEKLLRYLLAHIPDRKPFFKEMEQFAQRHAVPIMDLYSMETVLVLLNMFRPKKILEIGTAIGYSALRMADATGAKIVTIERDVDRYELAKANIAIENKEDQITIIKGEAFEVFHEVSAVAPFDCLFIDAAKGQYQKFFETFTPLLTDHSVVITDNVLFKGYVIADEGENKRLHKLGKKIDRYNNWLNDHPDFHTVILPVGDGLAISVKKSGARA